jgi:hypothetical protein
MQLGAALSYHSHPDRFMGYMICFGCFVFVSPDGVFEEASFDMILDKGIYLTDDIMII